MFDYVVSNLQSFKLSKALVFSPSSNKRFTAEVGDEIYISFLIKFTISYQK